MTSMNRSRKAFTLIELLVVIAIIALLVSILVPSLQEARELAMRAYCMTTEKSIVLAASLYAEDHRGLYPRTDGSWLHRVRRGANNPLGMGLMAVNGYLPLDRGGVERTFFCPSSNPSWNWQSPPHTYNALVNLGSNVDAYATYSGKFCTFVGYNTATRPTQANLYTHGHAQTAARISPVLVADYVFSEPPQADSRQAHKGEGLCAGFYDAHVEWIDFDRVEKLTWAGTYNTTNPYGNFWHWAKQEFGIGD